MKACVALLWLAGCGLAHRDTAATDAGTDASAGGADTGTSCCDAGPTVRWTVAVIDGPGAGHRSSLVAAGGDELHVVYTKSGDGTAQELRYAHRPSGDPWQAPVVVDGGEKRVGDFPSLAMDGDGTLHVSYHDFDGADLRYARKPSGAAWAAPDIAAAGDGAGHGLYGSLVVDDAGAVAVIYSSGFDTFDLLHVSRSAAGSWSAPEPVDTAGTVGSHTSLAIDAQGGLHASYMDVSDDTVSYAYRAPGGTWMPNETIAAVTETIGESDSSLAVDADGGVHVSYFDYGAGELRYTYRAPGGDWAAPVTIDAGDIRGTSSLAVDDAGGVHVSYQDELFGLKYAHRTPDGVWQEPEVADGAAGAGGNTSLALDGEGGVHVTYFDAEDRQLEHAYRSP